MTTTRKLEDIASNLDDLSITLEEIKEEIKSDATRDTGKLDNVLTDMESAADTIEESVTCEPPEQ